MVEKRRRDRMNNSLAQLKSLLAVNVKHNVSSCVHLIHPFVSYIEQNNNNEKVMMRGAAVLMDFFLTALLLNKNKENRLICRNLL